MYERSAFAPDERGDLHDIFYVDADDEYNCRTRRITDPASIAIRTLAGAGAMDIEGVGLVIVPENSVYITDLRRIRYYGTYEQSWRFYWFKFSHACGIGMPLDEVTPIESTVWEEPVIEHIFRQLGQPDRDAQVSAAAFFRALLSHWTSALAARDRRSNSAALLVRRAIARIGSAGSEPISIEQLATDLGVGPRRLHQAFIQELGRSPKRYYTEIRMRQAAQALKMGRGSVTQIAEQLGYASPFHFSRAFKAEFGCSPSYYEREDTASQTPIKISLNSPLDSLI